MKWLKRILREWLKEEQTQDISRAFTALIDQELLTVIGHAVVGHRIQCIVPLKIGQSIHLISLGQAADPEHFKALWKQLGGKAMMWEDGSEVELV